MKRQLNKLTWISIEKSRYQPLMRLGKNTKKRTKTANLKKVLFLKQKISKKENQYKSTELFKNLHFHSYLYMKKVRHVVVQNLSLV